LSLSNDVFLLATTGRMLVEWGSRRHVDFNADALGRSYLDRAVQLDPPSVQAKQFLRILRLRDNPGDIYRMPGMEWREDISKLPEAERLPELARIAEAAYIRGDMDGYYKHDAAAAKASWDVSRKAAADALQLAPTRRGDPACSRAIYSANMIAGLLAIRDGDRPRAVRHLLAAVEVPASEDLAYTIDYATFRLPSWLLKDGEREPVITFLEKLAAMNIGQRAYLLESAELIRKGVKPLWYPASSI